MRSKVLITSALPYANGPLHFGHIAGAYLPGDCYARFERLMGKDVLYICGSDEYGVAITLSADIAKRFGTSVGDRCSPWADHRARHRIIALHYVGPQLVARGKPRTRERQRARMVYQETLP